MNSCTELWMLSRSDSAMVLGSSNDTVGHSSDSCVISTVGSSSVTEAPSSEGIGSSAMVASLSVPSAWAPSSSAL